MPMILTEREKRVNKVSSYEELLKKEMAKKTEHTNQTIGRDSTGKIISRDCSMRAIHRHPTGIITITCNCPVNQKKTEPIKQPEPVKLVTKEQLDTIITQIKTELEQGFAVMSSQLEASTEYLATLRNE
jgi:hypothetical protein